MGPEECVEFEVQQALEFRSQGSAIGSCESQPDWAHYRAPREANEGHHEARDDVVSAIVPVVLGKRKMGLLATNMVSGIVSNPCGLRELQPKAGVSLQSG
jgi:hypothetical protein